MTNNYKGVNDKIEDLTLCIQHIKRKLSEQGTKCGVKIKRKIKKIKYAVSLSWHLQSLSKVYTVCCVT